MKLSPIPSFFFLTLIAIFPLIYSQQSAKPINKYYEKCSKPFECGYINNLAYPFYDGVQHPDYCGHPGFQLNCNDDLPEISIDSSKYYVVSTEPKQSLLTVARIDYHGGNFCPTTLLNTTIDFSLFKYGSSDVNVTLYYGCSNTSNPRNQFYCDDAFKGYFLLNTSESSDPNGHVPTHTCKSNIFVPISNQSSSYAKLPDKQSLAKAFNEGFKLEWIADNSLCDECKRSGGVCGYSRITRKFTCHCPDKSYNSNCHGSSSAQAKMKNKIIVSCSAIGIGLLLILPLVYCVKRKYPSVPHIFEDFLPHMTKTNQEVESFIKKYGTTTPRRYTYTNLKRITNSFKVKLGEGGYGVVYKGNLSNGQLVAVKMLKQSKEDAKEFINEVASIGMTNHRNIVKLLGFCFEGRKQALVYEFMSNGSLDKFVYGKENNQSLSWEKLFEIAIGIARGLEYLHRGCSTRILHFDIKPHNILLDESFCPKISDFGLAKSSTQKESIISMSQARGTVGYIAPEVFLRNFGGVSNKSDVYSYGMLALEMVGCRKKIGDNAGSASENYFPHYVYKQLETWEESDDQEIMSNKEDRELQRKMIIVSLWCVQTNPRNRPTMSKVVEMLEGAMELLPNPPTISASSSFKLDISGCTTMSSSQSIVAP